EPVTIAETLPADTAPAPPVKPATDYLIRGLQRGQNRLFEYLGVNLEDSFHPCLGDQQVLRCENTELAHWDQVTELNRPLLLTLITRERLTAYAVLTGIEDEYAQVLDANNQPVTVSLAELGPLWTGSAFYAWRSPPGFRGALTQGDRGQLVAWLAEQFALMDGQQRPLAQDVYNRALAERVKIFQQQSGLVADGIAGPQTLMKINEAMGLDTTLKRQGVASHSAVEHSPATGQ
ncbi:MAG TPA: peptidoglycan-binding domain-containing protein, partial [Cellvibrionaceae bacterium]